MRPIKNFQGHEIHQSALDLQTQEDKLLEVTLASEGQFINVQRYALMTSSLYLKVGKNK